MMQPPPFLALLALSVSTALAQTAPPVEMRLLVLAGDGAEPGFQALKFFLDHLGVPYDALPLYDRTTDSVAPLPALSNASQGFYQGIILATGNLAFQRASGAWDSGVTPAHQAALESYMRSHKVRLLSYYTYPSPLYGMAFAGAASTTDSQPGQATITAAGASLFPYLTRLDPVKVTWSYCYLANAVQAAGETTTPVLRMNGAVVGVLHTKPDGREYLALTLDNSPYLTHSMILNYGLFNWVTRGLFLGYRKAYLSPQSDDLFLPNTLFVSGDPNCWAVGQDQTFDPSLRGCPTLRVTGADLTRLATWQTAWNAKAQTRGFKVTVAFNGEGATPEGGAAADDSLVLAGRTLAAKFFWVSHTYDHENLDCFQPVPFSGVCRPATFGESVTEIVENVKVAQGLGLALDAQSMVTPQISGLANPEFLRAAAGQGLRYLVSDFSRNDYLPALANGGVYSNIQPGMLLIPRRATNIFYNTATARTGIPGSLPEEYNFFYGPAGYFRLPDGSPFFTTAQTYDQIIQRESDNLLSYMLRYEFYPSMFHQSNFWRYDGTRSLFTDVIDATLNKFTRLSRLPVVSLPQSGIGQIVADRMAFQEAGVRALLTPGVSIRLTARRTAKVPVTGLCKTGCEDYGGQKISYLNVRAGGAVTVYLP